MQRIADQRVRQMVRVGMLSAIAIILFMPMFEIPLFLPWMKLDLSTLPALLAGFAMGPLYGLCVIVIKCLVHIPMGSTGGIGELADFLCSSAMVLPAAFIYQFARRAASSNSNPRVRNRILALVGMIIGALLMTGVSVLANQYILLPLFASKWGGMEAIIAAADNPSITSVALLLLYGVVPFNLVKGGVLTVVTFLLYKPLSPLLHDRRA